MGVTPLPEPTQAPDPNGCHRCGWIGCPMVSAPSDRSGDGELLPEPALTGARLQKYAAEYDCLSRPEINWRALYFAGHTDAALRYLTGQYLYHESEAREIIEQVRAGGVEWPDVRAILGMGR